MAIRVVGNDLLRAQELLRDVERECGNPQKLLKTWGLVVQKRTVEYIRAGGDGEWRPLAPSTQIAKRKGGGGLPLQAFAKHLQTFTTPRTVVVEQTHWTAKWHDRGTGEAIGAGRYRIAPKNPGVKALAIPQSPYTLAGLGRSRRNSRGSFVYLPNLASRKNAGKTIRSGPRKGETRAAGLRRPRSPSRLAGRGVGQTVMAHASLSFFQSVMHPGVATRPVFPADRVVAPLLVEAGQAVLRRIMGDSTIRYR